MKRNSVTILKKLIATKLKLISPAHIQFSINRVFYLTAPYEAISGQLVNEKTEGKINASKISCSFMRRSRVSRVSHGLNPAPCHVNLSKIARQHAFKFDKNHACESIFSPLAAVPLNKRASVVRSRDNFLTRRNVR